MKSDLPKALHSICGVPMAELISRALKGAGVDRTPRGWEKTSDHAPVWVELEV